WARLNSSGTSSPWRRVSWSCSICVLSRRSPVSALPLLPEGRSPSAHVTRGLPTLMTSPGWPWSFSMVPLRGAGTSTSAFAVSILASVSNSSTCCPSLTHHSSSSASSRPSPRSGRRKSFAFAFVPGVAIGGFLGASSQVGSGQPAAPGRPRRGGSVSHHFLHRPGDSPALGEVIQLQFVVGHGHVEARHPLHRGLEVEEAVLLDEGGDLRPHAGGLGRLVYHDCPARLLHALDDRLDVDRVDRPQVDQLDADVLRQL